MLSICTFVAIFVAPFTDGIPVEEMRGVFRDRLVQLDGLVVELVSETRINDAGADPLDSSNWHTPLFVGDHRLTIVRPNVLHNFLKDDEQAGYSPEDIAIVDGGYTCRQGPLPNGMMYFESCDFSIQRGFHGNTPLLQAFDLHFIDGPRTGLNIFDLLADDSTILLRGDAQCSTYQTTYTAGNTVWTCEFELTARGTPMHVVTSIMQGATLMQSREQWTLSTMEVNGAELPRETLIETRMPNLAAHSGLERFVVQSVTHHDGMVREDVEIVIERQNAIVWTDYSDGRREKATYDASGGLVLLVSQNRYALADSVSKDTFAWRGAIPGVAAGAGILSMFALYLVSTNRSRRTRAGK